MMDLTDFLWPILVRTTIAVGIIGIVAFLLLRVLRVRAPTPVRIICCSVLVPGCVLFQIDLTVPDSLHAVVRPVVHDRSTDVLTAPSPPLRSAEFNAEVPPLVFDGQTLPPALNGPTENNARKFPVSACLVVAWGAGLLCLLSWSMAGYVVIWSRIRHLKPAESRWTAEWNCVLSRMNIRGPIRMLQSKSTGPLLFRMPGQAVLVIPESRWPSLTPDQRETVLLHEAAHLRRGDLWKSLFIRALALPQWFNPLAWWSLRRFDDAAEWACDDLVRSVMTGQTTDYARALVQLSTKSRIPRFVLSAADGRRLTARVRRILSPSFKEESRMKSLALCSLFVVISGLTALRPAAVADQLDTASSTPAGAADDDDLRLEPTHESNPTQPAASALDRQDDTSVATELTAPQATFANNTHAGREAVVDMSFLFQNDPVFQEHKELLQEEVDAGDTEMRETIRQLQSIQRQIQALNGDNESDVREALEAAVIELQAALQSRRENLRGRLVRAETEMYYTTYQRISAAIAEHARENGIRLVRRRNVVAEQNEDLTASPAGGANQGINLSNPQAILQLMNRDIVYIENGPLDITQAVFERLTEKSGSPAGSPVR